MQFTLNDGLPFINATIVYQGTKVTVPNVLIDTGSARTVFSIDMVSNLQIAPSPNDVLHTIRGVGGTEVVFMRQLEALQVGECLLSNFETEIGALDYGFDIHGILGMDFLCRAGAVLDFSKLDMQLNYLKD